MNFVKVRTPHILRNYGRATLIRGGHNSWTKKLVPASLLQYPIANLYSKKPTSCMIFRRHYAIEYKEVEDVSSLKDVDEVDAALKQMVTEGVNISATIQRQNENIKIGSELMIHAVYDSLLDLSLQLIIKTYPGGLEGLIDSASHAYTSFPPEMEALVNQVRDGLRSYLMSSMHESSLTEAVKMTTNLFGLVEKGHSELGILFDDHQETVSWILNNNISDVTVFVADRPEF